jgi:hypothetical protein
MDMKLGFLMPIFIINDEYNLTNEFGAQFEDEMECDKFPYVNTFIVEGNAINGGYVRLF